ncbi:MAG: response regulator receiver domain [Bacteroidota bacterium]
MTRHYGSFEELRRDAVEAFVRTAILIDNEPWADAEAPKVEEEPKVAKSAAARPRTGQAWAEREAEVLVKEPPVEVKRTAVMRGGHELSVRPVTNAFAKRKITCGFYFPSDEDADVVDTAFEAAKHVDVTILDWQLKAGDPGPAKEVVRRLLADDKEAGGRLRLIVIYTGERGLDYQCSLLKNHLDEHGFGNFSTIDSDRALRGQDALITFANKPAPGAKVEHPGSAVRPIAWTDLPQFVSDQFAHLAEGLLQAFALKGIGAVRDDTHHLVSVFGSDLDGAYLAQRGGIGTPADAEDLMTALLTSEFATSIADRGIDRDILGEASALALRTRKDPQKILVKKYKEELVYKDLVEAPKGQSKCITAGEETLNLLVKKGLNSAVLRLDTAELKKLKKQFFDSDAAADTALAKFARLTSFKREANSARRPGNKAISLTGGVVVRKTWADADGKEAQAFLLCMQPGCDAVRLSKPTPFPFCPMKENSQVFDLVVRIDNKEAFLLVDRRPRNLQLVAFEVDPSLGVVNSEIHNGKRVFWTEGRKEYYEFVAELRALEAQNFTSQLVGQFNRVALNGSEWLRLSGNGEDER